MTTLSVALGGMPPALATAIMGVLVASFAGTTLDTATRLQRYVIQEIGNALSENLPALTPVARPFRNTYVATGIAVVSAFGLAACDGVAAGLRAMGRGFEAAGHRVPIVPGAILFDLANGGDKGWAENPYTALGRAAFDARSQNISVGSAGAGTGATVAGLKGGLGTASAVLPSGAVVGALVAVNALGQVTVGDGPEFWAAPFEVGGEFGGCGIAGTPAGAIRTKLDGAGNTTIAVVATDVELSKAEATRMAVAAQDGIARAIVPSHTPMDGDLVFACSTGMRKKDDNDALLLGHVAATCLSRAIARGVYEANASEGDVLPTWKSLHTSSG